MPSAAAPALAGAARQVAGAAVPFQLGDVSAGGSPAADLTLVVGHPAAAEVAAIPLEPAPRVVGVNPAVFSPQRQRLRGIDAEKIQLGVVPLGAEAGLVEPLGREFGLAVGHVFATKHAQREQLFGSKLRAKIRMEILSLRLGHEIDVALLHEVIDDDSPLFHGCLCRSAAVIMSHS